MKRLMWMVAGLVVSANVMANTEMNTEQAAVQSNVMQRYTVTPSQTGYHDTIRGSVRLTQQRMMHDLVLTNQAMLARDAQGVVSQVREQFRVSGLAATGFPSALKLRANK
ncbi:hypothetical protein DFP83_10684 [Idiomarina fontislapidosi]|uniref:Uncharacterized protein n=1 Tax=Idiomarina fontislapidosi TaxID=263723 RepID=A0A432Y7Z2_9GAMM|nr:hypothetical protein [Idiomarina fontislapidosi]PYE32359.1 hypothetical protein DFP83_10684 [Idiomarina fontislapidosi]RUO57063.1 hypothetical protein CWE25_05140 [Idiomarina fontislapidosi]